MEHVGPLFLEYGVLGVLALLFVTHTVYVAFKVMPQKEAEYRADLAASRDLFLGQLDSHRKEFLAYLREERQSWHQVLADLGDKFESLENHVVRRNCTDR